MENGILFEIEELASKVNNSQIPEELRLRIAKLLERLKKIVELSNYSQEYESISKYVDWVLKIPWNKYTDDNLDLESVKLNFDKTHYGMENIKSMILDYLSVPLFNKQNNKKVSLNSMCFVGLQGVGKTSIAKSIANVMGRKLVRIPMGAIGSVNELRGTVKSNLNSEPGRIIKSLINSESMNPVILLDEIDKASGNEGLRTDIMSYLLEILDPQQNSHYTDFYIDYPVDLSNVLFITTANNTGTMTTALLDRLEVIRFTGYNDDEKIQIAKRHLLPKVLEEYGVNSGQIIINDDVWPLIIRPLGYEAGVRQLERNIATICRKAVRKMIENKQSNVSIDSSNINDFITTDISILN